MGSFFSCLNVPCKLGVGKQEEPIMLATRSNENTCRTNKLEFLLLATMLALEMLSFRHQTHADVPIVKVTLPYARSRHE